MKTFKSAVGWGALAISIIIIFASCGSKSGGIGGITPIQPPKDTSGKLSISASSSKGWYGDTLIGPVKATNATSITAYPGTIVGETYVIPNVTGPIQVRLVASGNNNQSAETTVVADCYNPVHSILAKKSGTWNQTAQKVSADSIIWTTGTPDCRPILFLKNNTGKFLASQCGGTDSEITWSLNSNETGLKTGTSYFKTIISINENTMVLRYENPSPTVTQWIEETYTKQ